VCEPVFNKPLKDISFGQVLLRLFQTARQFNMEVQPQLMLLQKTLVQIEGLGRALYPELDLWETGLPVLRAWVREQSGPRATLRRLRAALPELRDTLEKLPHALRRFVEQMGEEQAAPMPEPDKATDARADARAPGTSAWYGLAAGSALLLAGVVFIGLRAHPGWAGWLLGAAGLVVMWMQRPPRG
jgi:ubiquinone biosynthesis protein